MSMFMNEQINVTFVNEQITKDWFKPVLCSFINNVNKNSAIAIQNDYTLHPVISNLLACTEPLSL